MIKPLIESHKRPTRPLLIQRVQIVLLISLVGVLVYMALDMWLAPRALSASFYVKLVGVVLAAAAFLGLQRPWAVRYAWFLSVGIVAAAYILTALSGMVGPSREYETTAVLFVGASIMTAAIIPWGMWPQCITVVIGALALAAAVVWADGSLHVLPTDPEAAVVIAFALSVMTAREVQRYRLAYRRELQVRKRAESAVIRLNAQLEQRVLERTAALEMSNQMLVQEIAERRRTANALRVSQAQLADIVDNSTAMISLKDLKGRYLLVNREFEHCLRRSRGDVVGRTDRDLFPAALVDRLCTGDAEVLAGSSPLSFEHDFGFADDRRSYVCVKFPLHGASAAVYGVGSVCTNITPLKQLQEEVRRHQDELAHVLRVHTIGEMTTALAHEINQPLGAITNYAQGAAQRLRAGAADPAALLQVCEEITREGLRAAQVIRAMRSLVTRETRPSAALDVNALAAEAARVLEPQARLHGVTVRVDGATEMPPVQGDGTQIEQVMLNLMLNGVEAIVGGDCRRREVVVATTVSGNAIEVAVSDTGDGIAPSVAHKLFTPFFTTKSSGLGLGLVISRSIVESHGGRLWASTNPPAGSTFRFSLPIAAATPPSGSSAIHL